MVIIQNTSTTRTEVITELRRIYFDYFENTRMSIENFSLYSKMEYITVKRHFGSWENALNRAEINHIPRPTLYDEKVILEALRRVYFDYFENTRMNFADFSLHSKISYTTVIKHFDSWEAALSQAEINCSPKRILYDKKSILVKLKVVYFEHFENTRMRIENFKKHSKISYATIIKHFDSWENALNQAEINCQPKGAQYDKTAIIAKLKAVYFDHFENTRMTYTTFSLHCKISYYDIIKHFDSWENALSQAEINCIPRIKLQDEKSIVKELRRVYFEYFENTRLTIENFQMYSNTSYRTVIKHFNSWENALSQAEINCKPYGLVYDTTTIIVALRAVYLEHFQNTRMSFANFCKHSKISYATIIKHFGSWINAQRKAEINSISSINKHNEKIIIAELRRVYFDYFENNIMTINDFHKHSEIRIRVIKNHFDSWLNALHQAEIKSSPKYIKKDRKTIIEELRRVYYDHSDHTRMTIEKFSKHSQISYPMVIKYFGSWENVLHQAEINSSPRGIKLDKNTIIEELRRVYFVHFEHTRMTIEKFSRFSKIKTHWVFKHFGTWENALNQAEINSNPIHNDSNEKVIIATIRRIYFENFENTQMTIKNLRLHYKITDITIKKHFGSWSNLLKKAEINSISSSKKHNEKIIIAELKRVYFEHFENTRMTVAAFCKHSKINIRTIKKHFDSWENALCQAEIKRNLKYDKKTIIETIQQVYFDYFENRIMTLRNFIKHCKISDSTIYRHFNTWKEALNQAEINCGTTHLRWDKKTIIAELRRVYFDHFENTRMTVVNFNKHSKISIRTIRKYLDSWENALSQAEIVPVSSQSNNRL